MTTYISYPNIGWSVAVECDNTIHRYISVLFSAFFVDRNISGLLDAERTLTIYKTEKGYQFKKLNIICRDVYHTLGMAMEILMSPQFLKSKSCIFLHGATLVKAGKLVTIVAPTQQGKSTATALLVMRGYHYLSDDVIPIDTNTLQVFSFPKALCIRDISILDNEKHSLTSFFYVAPFYIKNDDNMKCTIEARVPLLPHKTVTAKENNLYKMETVVFLERNDKIAVDHYELSPIDRGSGYLRLIQNLRNPEEISGFRKVGAKITQSVKFMNLKYSAGYRYLDGFEGIYDIESFSI